MATNRADVVLEKALHLPAFGKLSGRRVVLASGSPRRKEILETAGFRPEIIPSAFAENLPKSHFDGRLADYPIATAGEKALEVYERLLKANDKDPADLVISADTVVIFPPERDTADGGPAEGQISEILEKPISKEEQVRSLSAMSGRSCEVVTGVCIVYPCVEAPGYKLQSISSSTICHFFDNSEEVVQAYVDSEEGLDRAGGFAIQGLGGILIDRIEGSYDNCVGFPSAHFWRWIGELSEYGVFDEAWS